MLILPVKEKGALQCCIAKRSKDGSPSRNRRMPGSRVNWHAPGETNALVKWHLGKRFVWEQNNMTLATLHGSKRPRSIPRRAFPTAFFSCAGMYMLSSGPKRPAAASPRDAVVQSETH